MTLPEIASELDNLIQRLQTARTLLASLGPEAELSLSLPTAAVTQQPRLTRKRLSRRSATGTAAAITALSAQAGSSPVQASLPEQAGSASSPAPTVRSLRRSAHTVSASLAGKVPTAPVAVSAAEIRRRFTPAPTPEPAVEPAPGNSLDDLLRELAHRPLGGVTL